MTVSLRNTPLQVVGATGLSQSNLGTYNGTSPVANDLLVAVVQYQATTSTALGATPSGWSLWQTATDSGGTHAVVAIYTRIASGGDAAPTFTATLTGTAARCLGEVLIYDFSDSSGGTPSIQAFGTASGTSASPIAPVTNSRILANGYAIGAASTYGSVAVTWTTPTLPSTWTSRGTSAGGNTFASYANYSLAAPAAAANITCSMAFSAGTTTFQGAIVLEIGPPVIYGATGHPSALGHPSDAGINALSVTGTGAQLPCRGRDAGYSAVRQRAAQGTGSQFYPARHPIAAVVRPLPRRGRAYGIVKAGPPSPAPPSYSSSQPAGVRVIYQRAGIAQASMVTTVTTAPVLATFYPLNRPAAAVTRPLPRRGQTRSNPGVYDQAGPSITPQQRPSASRARGLPPRGRSAAQPGAFQGAGSLFYPARHPIAAVARPFSIRGRSASLAGAFQGAGSAFYPLRHPVAAVTRPFPLRGRTAGRAGTFTPVTTLATFYPLNHAVQAEPRLPSRGTCRTNVSIPYQGSGPSVTPLQRPVQARRLTPRGGSAQWRYGTFTPPVSVTAFYPLNRPAEAVVRPLPVRGRSYSRAGIFGQAGPQFYPLNHPVQARRPLPPRGTAAWRYGTFTPPPQNAPFYPLSHPVQARQPLPRRGRTQSLPGIFQGAGSQFYPLRHPAAARQPLPLNGRTYSRAGVFGQAGPPVTPLQRPVQARRPLSPRGTAQWRYGTLTVVLSVTIFYPASHPIAAVTRPLPVRGRSAGRAGTYQGSGPALTPLQRPVRPRLALQQPPPKGSVRSAAGIQQPAGSQFYPLRHPVAAIVRPLPVRGRVQGRAGVLTPVIQAGPPVYPLQRPVAAVVRPLPARGRAQGHAGVFRGSGPAVKPLQHPVYAWRPGPRRGICVTSVRPPAAAGTGSKFYPLRRPVRAPYPPLLPRTGGDVTATPPYAPPFIPAGGHAYPYDASLVPAPWSAISIDTEWKGDTASPVRYFAQAIEARWPSAVQAGRWFTTSGPA